MIGFDRILLRQDTLHPDRNWAQLARKGKD